MITELSKHKCFLPNYHAEEQFYASCEKQKSLAHSICELEPPPSSVSDDPDMQKILIQELTLRRNKKRDFKANQKLTHSKQIQLNHLPSTRRILFVPSFVQLRQMSAEKLQSRQLKELGCCLKGD